MFRSFPPNVSGGTGGNTDVRQLVAGSRLRLPMFVEGAKSSAGDGHMTQGAGEVSGTGLETLMSATLRFDVMTDDVRFRPEEEITMHTTRGRDVTPVGAVARGLAAGALGTLGMDLLWYARYRREDGKSRFAHWELSGDVLSWDAAPAPAVVGKRLVESLFHVELPDHRAGPTNNITHWGYGMLMGAQYGLLAGSLRGRHLWLGLPFGAAVWGSSYVVLPAAGLYKPIWEYDRRTLTKDLTAHLVFGLGTAVAFAALAGEHR